MEPIKEEVHCKETLCRICASCTELLIPIFEGEGLENNISDKIHKYLPIQVEIFYRTALYSLSRLIFWNNASYVFVYR